MTNEHKPLTESLRDFLIAQDAPHAVQHAAEEADLLRSLLTPGTPGGRELATKMAQIMVTDPHGAALTIGLLAQVAVRADRIIASGVASFNALPKEAQEAIRDTVPGV